MCLLTFILIFSIGFQSESPNNRQSIRRSTPVVPATVLPTANNDISNKFWEFVNLYCGEVEPEHVEVILIHFLNICLFNDDFSLTDNTASWTFSSTFE